MDEKYANVIYEIPPPKTPDNKKTTKNTYFQSEDNEQIPICPTTE